MVHLTEPNLTASTTRSVHSAPLYKATDHHQDEHSGGFLLLSANTFQHIKNAPSLLQSKQQRNLSYKTILNIPAFAPLLSALPFTVMQLLPGYFFFPFDPDLQA